MNTQPASLQSISRLSSEALLRQKDNGVYVLRHKADDENKCVLSVSYKGVPTHHLIGSDDDGLFTLNGKKYGEHRSVEELVEALKQPKNGWKITLSRQVHTDEKADDEEFVEFEASVPEIPMSEYLHGTLTRKSAEELLAAVPGQAEGRFLVRIRAVADVQYTIRPTMDGGVTVLVEDQKDAPAASPRRRSSLPVFGRRRSVMHDRANSTRGRANSGELETHFEVSLPGEFILSLLHRGQISHHILSQSNPYAQFKLNNTMATGTSSLSKVIALLMSPDALPGWPVTLKEPVPWAQSPESLMREAILCKSDGSMDDAISSYTAAIKVIQRSSVRMLNRELLAKAYAGRAEILIAMNKIHPALDDADATVANRPDWWRGHYLVGTVLFLNKSFTDAVWCLKQSLQLLSRNDVAYDKVSKALAEARKQELITSHITEAPHEDDGLYEELPELPEDLAKKMAAVAIEENQVVSSSSSYMDMAKQPAKAAYMDMAKEPAQAYVDMAPVKMTKMQLAMHQATREQAKRESGSAPPPAPSTGARRSSVDIDSTYDHLDSKRSSSGTVSIKRPSDFHEYEDPDKGAEYEDPDKDAEYEEISGPEEDADDDLYVRRKEILRHKYIKMGPARLVYWFLSTKCEHCGNLVAVKKSSGCTVCGTRYFCVAHQAKKCEHQMMCDGYSDQPCKRTFRDIKEDKLTVRELQINGQYPGGLYDPETMPIFGWEEWYEVRLNQRLDHTVTQEKFGCIDLYGWAVTLAWSIWGVKGLQNRPIRVCILGSKPRKLFPVLELAALLPHCPSIELVDIISTKGRSSDCLEVTEIVNGTLPLEDGKAQLQRVVVHRASGGFQQVQESGMFKAANVYFVEDPDVLEEEDWLKAAQECGSSGQLLIVSSRTLQAQSSLKKHFSILGFPGRHGTRTFQKQFSDENPFGSWSVSDDPIAFLSAFGWS